jgi:alpha/beta superfamily hydrolase
MDTKAVYRLGRALNDAGLRTLRFNFRGVGYSTGTFEQGIGEEEDVRAALDWLELGLRDHPLVVGGVSFGSMVGMKVATSDPRVVAMVAVGTPIHVYDYTYLTDAEKPVLVVQGENDEFGSGEEVERTLGGLGPHMTVRIVPGADHLLEGHLDVLQSHVQEFFGDGPGAAAIEGYSASAERTGS